MADWSPASRPPYIKTPDYESVALQEEADDIV